jgi:hypothetical protein
MKTDPNLKEESEDFSEYEKPEEKRFCDKTHHFLRSLANELKNGRKRGHAKKIRTIQPDEEVLQTSILGMDKNN